MRNGDDASPAGQSNSRFDPDDIVGIRRAYDTSVGLGANGQSRKVGGLGCTRSGARAAWIAIEAIGIVSLAAYGRPAADGLERAEIGPFRQVGLAENDGPAGAQIGGHG